MTNHHHSSGRGRSSFWVILILVVCLILLPAFYVLSIGPVVMLGDNGFIPQSFEPAFEIIYMPLILLHEHTLLREPLEWYVELWA